MVTERLIKLPLEPADDNPEVLTPGGMKTIHAPVDVTPGMYLWLLIDKELAGARGDGCPYPDPRAVTHVLEEVYPEEIDAWFDGCGLQVEPSERRRWARQFVSDMADGRGEALSERIEPESRS